jgi:hypothetical protein
MSGVGLLELPADLVSHISSLYEKADWTQSYEKTSPSGKSTQIKHPYIEHSLKQLSQEIISQAKIAQQSYND